MNLLNSVSAKMECVQKTFLGVQSYMLKEHQLEEVIAFLDAEPPEFRSVAYESASMEIASLDLSNGNGLSNWKNFYHRSAKAHTFHMDIGLGWAFAKKERSPVPYFESLQSVISCMVYDGIGYYNGLFNGRRTVKSQLIPGDIDQQTLPGFDQGLGRRLWYISKGNIDQLIQLIKPFPLSRHADLWRGVGIACGYVGGNDKTNLEQLVNHSAEFKDQFCNGITLAAISRHASDSITKDIEVAYEIICGRPLKDLLNDEPARKNLFGSIPGHVHIN
jgi:hypothetical protein